MSPAVLQLISSSGFYGAERVLLELARELAQQGWGSHVGALLNRGQRTVELVRRARALGLPTALFPCGAGFDARTVAALRRHVRDNHIDVVHCHGYKSDIFAFLCHLQPRTRLVATCHNWLTDSLRLMAYELLDKLTLHSFDRVVAVSPPLERELRAAGLDARTVRLIENGLALERSRDPGRRARLRAELGLADHDRVVVAVGRLDPWKAYDVLLAALARPPVPGHVKLLLVGDGPLRPQLERRAGEPDLRGRVRFAGYREDVGDLLGAGDLFVISSSKEGLPMVLLEAMAAGLPVVATEVGAIPDVLRHGELGLLVPPGQPDALARAMAEVLGRGDRGRALGQAALAEYRARYSRAAMGRRYAALYRELEPTP